MQKGKLAVYSSYAKLSIEQIWLIVILLSGVLIVLIVFSAVVNKDSNATSNFKRVAVETTNFEGKKLPVTVIVMKPVGYGTSYLDMSYVEYDGIKADIYEDYIKLYRKDGNIMYFSWYHIYQLIDRRFGRKF